MTFAFIKITLVNGAGVNLYTQNVFILPSQDLPAQKNPVETITEENKDP